MSVGLHDPGGAFVGIVEFVVGKEVADKFCPVESERLDAVTFSPVPEDDTLAAQQPSIEGDLSLAVAHQRRERHVAALDVDGNGTAHACGQVNQYLDFMVLGLMLDIKRLAVDGEQVIAGKELPSRVFGPHGLNHLVALLSVKTQMADAVVE